MHKMSDSFYELFLTFGHEYLNNREHNGKVACNEGFIPVDPAPKGGDHINVNTTSYCLNKDMTMTVTYFTLYLQKQG